MLATALLVSPIFGQVTGVVTDSETGDGLLGASVLVIENGKGATTDENGLYRISLPDGSYTLKVSYVGYQDVEKMITVSGPTTMDFELMAGITFGNDIVVSASKRPEKLTESISTIDVINAEEIDNYAGNAAELLSRQKGIDYFRAGIAGPAFNVRGFNSNFNSKNLQVTDGRFSSLIATGLPFGQLDPVLQDDIERMEVILGPNSTMYGPNAHNGLLNTITKDPRTYPGLTVTGVTGVSGDGDPYFGVRGRYAMKVSDNFAFKVNAGWTGAEEFEYVDSVYINRDDVPGNEAYPELELDRDVEFLKANGEMIYSTNSGWDFSLGAGYSNSTFLSPTNVGRNQIKDWQIGYYQFKVNNDRFFAQLYYTTSKTDSTYSIDDRTKQYYRLLDAGYSDAEARGPLSYASGAIFQDNSNRLNAEAQYNNRWGNLQLITGVQYQLDHANSNGTYLLDNNGDGIDVRQIGGYAHLKYDLDRGWKIVGAARVDNHEVYGTNFIPKFGILNVGEYGTFRFTYGQGIAAPTILNMYGDLFSGLILGNAEGFTLADGSKVDPQTVEKLSTFEIGYRGHTSDSKLFFDANAYYNINKDFLSPVTVVGVTTQRGDTPIDQVQSGYAAYGGLVATYINFGKINTYGVDVGLNYYFTDRLNGYLNYSYFGNSYDKNNLDNDFNNDGVVNYQDVLINAPANKLNFGGSYTHNEFSVSLAGRWVQKYNYFSSFQIASETIEGDTYRGTPIVENARSTDSFNYGPLGGFVTFDVNLSYAVTPRITVGAALTNIFNQELREFTASAPTKGLYTVMFKYNWVPTTN